MLEHSRGLPPSALQAVADLERRVVEHDGGRLKLEWGTLRARPADRVEDLLWWDGDRLDGFLGRYAFGGALPELAGMVAPDRRRRGIATALLDAALRLCRDQGCPQVLLVVPRQSRAGHALALARGGVLDHSEHALVLRTGPAQGRDDPAVRLRLAGPADADAVSTLLTAGFGTSPADAPAPGTLLVEVDGAAVGTLRLTRDGDEAGVYGFAVDPAWRGRGIGRDVLRRVCRRLRAEGARRIGLEVAVDNPAALGLYTSLGFTTVTTEDYYALATQVQ